MKALSDLLGGSAPGLSDNKSVADTANMITGLSLDSRLIRPGMAFVALQGLQAHGLAYASRAADLGATAVLYDPIGVDPDQVPILPETVRVLPVKGLAQQLALIANRFNDYPSKKMATVGITGTDGKTSVSHFIAQAMGALGYSWSVIGTLGVGLPNALEQATHTTPDLLLVQAYLKQFNDAGIQGVAMEVSSHALTQGRVAGVTFDTAVLTNLGRDHLDYHQTLEAYAAAKRRLFEWPDLKNAVLNLDDAFGRELYASLQKRYIPIIAYGVGAPADYPKEALVAEQVDFSLQGIQARLQIQGKPWSLEVPVLGRFNMHNVLATLGVLLLQGITPEKALAALSHIKTVPGRMERVSAEYPDALVVVDYAHTADALASALQALRHHTTERLLCVFGCGGDRDRGKRPLMAQAAEQYADKVFVTDDNPRNESPEQIFTDIRQGFTQPDRICFVHDRAAAIQQAVDQAQPGDAVLIAGKGHETVQLVQGQTIYFDDRTQAQQALSRRLA